MLRTTSLILLFSFFCGNSFGYEKLLNNTSWYTGYSYHHPPATALWWHTIGDTSISGKIYKVVRNNLDTTYKFHKVPKEIYLREDSLAKTVFYLDSFMVEQVWYDFNLNLGDTVLNNHGKLVHVVAIDSIITSRGKRRRLIFNNRNYNPALIEGVGWEDGNNDFLRFHYSNYQNWSFHLTSCMYKNREQEWVFTLIQTVIECQSMCPSIGSADKLSDYQVYLCSGDTASIAGPCDTSFYWAELSSPSVAIATTDTLKVVPSVSTTYVWVGSLKTDTVSVFVLPDTLTSVDPTDTTFFNSTPYSLSSGTPSGGFYFGIGVSNGKFDPSVAGIGTHSIYYTLYDSIACSDTSEMKVTVLNNTGLIRSGHSEKHLIYPNPVEDFLKISTHSDKSIDYKLIVDLYDVLGKEVKHYVLEGNTLDVSDINPGTYLLIISNHEGRQLHKERLIKL